MNVRSLKWLQNNSLIEARDKGIGVVVVSADIDEVIKISDRIIVMFEGKIMGEISGSTPDMDKISAMMGGKEYESMGYLFAASYFIRLPSVLRQQQLFPGQWQKELNFRHIAYTA